MNTGRITKVIQHFRQVALGDGAGLSDGQLLDRFLASREETAFQALVRRHGQMVMGVCQRILRNTADADDAFQATFLVLVRKASGLLHRQTVGDWLYGVAYHTALKARAAAVRRHTLEMRVRDMATNETAAADAWHELRPIIDQELNRLADKYRRPLILCDLEGKTRKEAAQLLGWPEGTVHVRLARARVLLGKRLARQGVLLSGGSLAVLLAQHASAAVPAPLVVSTAKAAVFLAGGEGLAATAAVAALSDSMVQSMALAKLKAAAVVLLALGVMGSGMGAAAWHMSAGGLPARKVANLTANDRKTETEAAKPSGDRTADWPPPPSKEPKTAVVEAVLARFPGAEIGEPRLDRDEATSVYCINLKHRGQNIEVTLTLDAVITLIEKEITAKDLPAPVARTLAARYPGARFRKIEEVFKVESQAETLDFYDVLLVTAQKKRTLTVAVAPDGKIVKEDK
jgi:RNA polymerase sigma factor (sigma-70 family)